MNARHCLTLRDNNHLETGMRQHENQYENQSVADRGTMASIEADVKGGEVIGIIIFSSDGIMHSLRCNIGITPAALLRAAQRGAEISRQWRIPRSYR
jgi:hypothetical protein